MTTGGFNIEILHPVPQWGGVQDVMPIKDYINLEYHPMDSRIKIDKSDVAQTLNARMGTGGGNVPLIMEPFTCGNGQNHQDTTYEMAGALNCMHDQQIVGEADQTDQYVLRRLTPAECQRLQGFPDGWGKPDIEAELADFDVRFWANVRKTHAEINGKPVKDWSEKQMRSWYERLHTDSAEYKMWGNGVALPCVLYIMEGIVEAYGKESYQED